MTKSILLIFLMAVPLSGYAGETEVSSASIESPHGGEVHSSSRMQIELVSDGGRLKVYPLNKGLRPIPLQEVSVSGVVRSKKGEMHSVVLRPAGDHWEGQVGPKTGYRFHLELTLKYRGQEDKASFEVERSE